MDDVLTRSVETLHDLFDASDLEVEAKKIQQKMEEARYNPGDVRPLADCVFSILLAARSQGFAPDVVLDEVRRVAEEVVNRRWKKMPDGTYQSF